MRANSKPGIVLVMYTIILYSFWSLLELYLKTKIGIDEFTKEVYFKCVLWLIPAILIHFSFSNHMFSKKEEMYSLNKNTTLSKSLAKVRFASLVVWAYTFIVVLTSACPRSSCTSLGAVAAGFTALHWCISRETQKGTTKADIR